jgi:hypothetical protein
MAFDLVPDGVSRSVREGGCLESGTLFMVLPERGANLKQAHLRNIRLMGA